MYLKPKAVSAAIGSVADINNQGTFGVINSDAGARVMQFSLRFDF